MKARKELRDNTDSYSNIVKPLPSGPNMHELLEKRLEGMLKSFQETLEKLTIFIAKHIQKTMEVMFTHLSSLLKSERTSKSPSKKKNQPPHQ
ncbi:hypothetical protein TNCV_3906401 [Trichonephila clavipes]|nr:hypothetical protein TNCV_3906401 [Trichonephila clavipes]